MADCELAINEKNLKEMSLYLKDTVTIHIVKKVFTSMNCTPAIFREFSLLDDPNVTCRPRVFYEESDEYCFDIVFLTSEY